MGYTLGQAAKAVGMSKTSRACTHIRMRGRSARRRQQAPFGLQIPVAASTVTDPSLPRLPVLPLASRLRPTLLLSFEQRASKSGRSFRLVESTHRGKPI